MPFIGNSPYQVAFLTDTFSGNGSTTAFTMSVAPANTSSVLVAVSGVLQDPSTYSVSGTTLTFSAAPPTGTGNISARYLGIPASGVTTTAYRTVTEFTATAGQTTFTPPSYTVGFIQVFRNGVLLGSADYTATNGTTVVLALGATAGDLVTVESFYVSSVLNAIPNTVGAVTPSLLSGNAPQITVYTSGSGTYTVPTNAKAIQVEMAGGGGGGGSSGSGTGNGSAGGTTTFGTSLLTCTGGGGGGGNTYGSPGGGGTATLSSPATGLALTGGSGMAIGFNISGTYVGGGAGGTAPFGGAGCAGPANASGGVGNANTGAGGGGGGSPVSQNGGCGGGSGAYIKAIITSPSATYSYAVGAGGAGGTAGGSNAGGAGAAGVIIVTAYF
jgi:hypothetical protein